MSAVLIRQGRSRRLSVAAIGQLYTAGEWVAKPGSEEAFIEAWASFARWTAANVPGAGPAHLTRDKADPLRFIAFGEWDDAASVGAWRERPEFKEFVARTRELCDEGHPGDFQLVATA